MPAPLNTLPFQYRTRAPMVERMRNDTMRSQLAEDHDRELEDYLGRLAPTGWVTPTLLAGWTNFGSDHPPARCREFNGMFQAQGMLNTGTIATGTVIFATGITLSHRPILGCVNNDVAATIEIDAAGNVKARNIVAAGWISFAVNVPRQMT